MFVCVYPVYSCVRVYVQLDILTAQTTMETEEITKLVDGIYKVQSSVAYYRLNIVVVFLVVRFTWFETDDLPTYGVTQVDLIVLNFEVFIIYIARENKIWL